MLMGRSFKYHRPRGIVASGAEEPNALSERASGDRAGGSNPMQRATTTELFDGLDGNVAKPLAQALSFDVGCYEQHYALAVSCRRGSTTKCSSGRVASGSMSTSRSSANQRASGRAHGTRDADRYEHFYAFVDVLVIGGGGIAGLTGRKGGRRRPVPRLLLIEQTAHWGGRAPVDGGYEIDGKPADVWVEETVEALKPWKMSACAPAPWALVSMITAMRLAMSG